ncbi:hypothetical protein D4N35_001900 [Siminovitchia fortis]|uniref:Uncharacterized protein n=1 Tax=Siminovitchia fortis TaxID=254758 RepID=A0A443J2L1_9BACI|nr:hypothetical protein D4N35_001900 [Siminovitchia fortis]
MFSDVQTGALRNEIKETRRRRQAQAATSCRFACTSTSCASEPMLTYRSALSNFLE